jgi:MYXO-CTERM domain-containing protein
MEVELDVTESFDSEQWTLYELELDEGDVTNSSLENLLEDTTYFLRARCFDGALISDWDQISFSVNTVNHSPESPVLVSPADGSVTTSEITFVVENSFDEDGDELTYSFAIIDYFGSEEFLEEGYPEGDGTTELYVEGLANGTYTWSVKATDSFGGESDWSVESEFTVDVEEELVVTGVEGDAGGCGCSSDGTSRGALGWLVLLGAVVGSSRLQRRKG